MSTQILTIDMGEWLEKELSTIQKINVPTITHIMGVKKKILGAKIADVENNNLAVASRLKKRVPDKLDPTDVAAALVHLFDFKRVALSEETIDGALLAVYVPVGANKPDAETLWRGVTSYARSNEGLYVQRKDFYDFLVMRFGITSKRDIEETLDIIKAHVPIVHTTMDDHLFVVKNGIYDRKADGLKPFSPDMVFTKKIGVAYNPNAINPIIPMPDGEKWDVETWLSELAVSPDVKTLFWQIIAASIQPNNNKNKSIWFYSESGNNGKGTMGQLIKNMLGKGNYSSLSVADFNHEFKKAALITATANIADENDVNMYIEAVRDYKASITGDDIIVNIKHKEPVTLQFRGLNIQMMNGLPKTKDKSGSFYRRLLIVPFGKSFTNNGERSYIKSDYIGRQDVLEYVLLKTIRMTFDEFIVPLESVAALEQYKAKNNPVIDYWNEFKDQFVWDLLPNDFLFDLYRNWYERSNPSGRVFGKQEFLEQLGMVIESDGSWDNQIRATSGISSSKPMKDDEPLITEYGLDQQYRNGSQSPWVNATYKGDNIQIRRDFARKPKYRGVVRL